MWDIDPGPGLFMRYSFTVTFAEHRTDKCQHNDSSENPEERIIPFSRQNNRDDDQNEFAHFNNTIKAREIEIDVDFLSL